MKIVLTNVPSPFPIVQTCEATGSGREIAALTFLFPSLSPTFSFSLLLTRLSSRVHNPPSLPRGGGGVPQPSSLLPLILLLFSPLSASSPSSPLRALTRPSLILSRTLLPTTIITVPASLSLRPSLSLETCDAAPETDTRLVAETWRRERGIPAWRRERGHTSFVQHRPVVANTIGLYSSQCRETHPLYKDSRAP